MSEESHRAVLTEQEMARLVELTTGARLRGSLAAVLRRKRGEDQRLLIEVLRRLLAGGEQAVPALEALARAVLSLDDPVNPHTSEESNVFRREGDYWTIAYDGQIVRLRDSKGLAYLAQLLGHPGQRFPVGELLAGSRHGAGPPPTAEHARLAVTKAIKGVLVRLAESHPTLFSHLSVTVRRGQVCCYTPDPRRSIRWVT